MARVTVEDSLRVVESRFSLVHVASQRGRQLLKGAHPLVESNNRPIVTALREIAAGKVTMLDPDEVVEEVVAKAAKTPKVEATEPKAKEAPVEKAKAKK